MGADRRPYGIMALGIFNQVAASVRKRFTDVFSSRSSTTGGLGIATDGSRWDSVNGTIEIKSLGAGLPNVAEATSLPSVSGTSYPMATVTMPTENNTIRIRDTDQGSSAAIWVQSSSDWWMVGIDAEYNTIPGNTSYAFAQNGYFDSQGANASNQFSFTNYDLATGTSYNRWDGWANWVRTNYVTNYSSSLTYSGPFFFSGPPKWNSSRNWTSSTNISGYTLFTDAVSNYASTTFSYWYPSGTGYGWNNVNYFWFTAGGNYFTFSFTNATTFAYSQILRVRQSVGGTVSTITSSIISAASTAKSLLVSLSGNQITARAYSDNNFVSQLGSDLVYTATGATVTTRFGIGISPSSYLQSDIIGSSIEITRN